MMEEHNSNGKSVSLTKTVLAENPLNKVITWRKIGYLMYNGFAEYDSIKRCW
jgi:hypothetical protein